MKRIFISSVLAALTISTAAVSSLQRQPLAATVIQAQSKLAGKSVVTIPFELVTRHIVVQVRINNSRPLSFVFDTGAQAGIVDIDVAKELGLKLQGEVHIGGAGGGTLPGSMVQEATWTLPGLEGFSQPIKLAIPLGKIEARFGHDFDGIIGAEFIKQFVIEVDYPGRVIKLHDKNQFSYSGSGESVPLQLDGQGHPIIEAEVTPSGGDPIKGKFVLDLGAGSALALTTPFVVEHRLLNSEIKTIKGNRSGRRGRTEQWAYRPGRRVENR